MTKLPRVLNPAPLGYKNVYDKCMENAQIGARVVEKERIHTISKGLAPTWATPWLHLADVVSRGTISVLEAMDTLRLGYIAEHLKVRESWYQHLL